MTGRQSKNLEDLYRERTTSSSRSEYRVLITLLAIAVIVRVFWLWWRPYPLSGDALDYLAFAKNIAFYHTFTLNISDHTIFATTSRPPVFPTLIAALWWGTICADYPCQSTPRNSGLSYCRIGVSPGA